MENQFVQLPPPPRLVPVFSAGFEAIANRITLIALPVLLDLFLWLGPRLQLTDLFDSWWRLTQQQPFVRLPDGVDPETARQMWMDFFLRFNLFAGLRTFPIGTASLMSGWMPMETPLGAPASIQAPSLLTAFGWTALILFGGWILGALYFRSVSGAALAQPLRPLGASMVQAVKLSLFWLGVLFVLGFPTLVFFAVLQLISPLLVQAALILLAVLALWLILPVYFSPHGIFAGQQDAFAAILSSLRMIRYTLPTSGLFLLGVLIISEGLRFLWRTPPPASWWTLVGIAGHAFISTALLASSFIYYRDINAWLNAVFEKMKQQPVSAKA